jgi:hypothetical protein
MGVCVKRRWWKRASRSAPLGAFATRYSSWSGSVITAYGANLDTKKIDGQAISNPAVNGYVKRQLDGWESM